MGTAIELEFSQITNPPSTTPTEPYTIEVKTEYYQIVAVSKFPTTSVIVTTPATIQEKQFIAFDLRQLVTTTITIEWTNTQVYPEGLSLLIESNPSEIVPVMEAGEDTVPCIFRNTVPKECLYLRDSDGKLTGQIKVTDLLLAE